MKIGATEAIIEGTTISVFRRYVPWQLDGGIPPDFDAPDLSDETSLLEFLDDAILPCLTFDVEKRLR